MRPPWTPGSVAFRNTAPPSNMSPRRGANQTSLDTTVDGHHRQGRVRWHFAGTTPIMAWAGAQNRQRRHRGSRPGRWQFCDDGQ
jgi:hypothetical protein